MNQPYEIRGLTERAFAPENAKGLAFFAVRSPVAAGGRFVY
jgi:hypothetical protein